GVAGSLHGAPYGATKAGLIGLTKTLARELAPDVRCNAIAPGPVATEMWFAIDPAVQAQVMEREMPLKRIAQPEDIARAGLDISAWPDASGIVVLPDGGRIMGGSRESSCRRSGSVGPGARDRHPGRGLRRRGRGGPRPRGRPGAHPPGRVPRWPVCGP